MAAHDRKQGGGARAALGVLGPSFVALTSAQPFAPGLFATNTNNGAPDGVPSFGILSGPPTGMRVYLQSIALMNGAQPTII